MYVCVCVFVCGLLYDNGAISKLNGKLLKLLDQFTNFGSNISSTESDVNIRIGKAWTAIERLWIVWKSDLSEKVKREYIQAVAVSVLLYGGTTWTLTILLEKKLHGN